MFNSPSTLIFRRCPDDHAVHSLRQSSTADVQPSIKTESHNAPIKQEQVLYGPSKTFRSAIEELQQARRMHAQGLSHPPINHSATNESVNTKREDIPSTPSDSFVAAFNAIRRGHSSENTEGQWASIASTGRAVHHCAQCHLRKQSWIPTCPRRRRTASWRPSTMYGGPIIVNGSASPNPISARC